jgi:hypothetical protein
MLLYFHCALHLVNRFAHKHAMAAVIVGGPQSQADTPCTRAVALVSAGCRRPSPQSRARGSAAIQATGICTGTNSAYLRGPENGDAEKNKNTKYYAMNPPKEDKKSDYLSPTKSGGDPEMKLTTPPIIPSSSSPPHIRYGTCRGTCPRPAGGPAGIRRGERT